MSADINEAPTFLQPRPARKRMVSIRLNPIQDEYLRRAAAARGVPCADLVREALDNFLSNFDWPDGAPPEVPVEAAPESPPIAQPPVPIAASAPAIFSTVADLRRWIDAQVSCYTWANADTVAELTAIVKNDPRCPQWGEDWADYLSALPPLGELINPALAAPYRAHRAQES